MILGKANNYLIFILILSFSVCPAQATDTEREPPMRAVLGINIANGDPGAGPVEGVTIVGITPGGAADSAGLRIDDVIVEIGAVALMAGTEREANDKLLAFMAQASPGDRIALVYLRDGRAEEALLTAGALDPDRIDAAHPPFIRDLERLGRRFGDEFIEPFRYRWRHHGLFAGLELVPVTPGLGRYFGTDRGLLVIRAPDNAALGLQDGDVILTIGDRIPNDPGHAMRILGSYEPGEAVTIRIRRDQRDDRAEIRFPARADDNAD